MNSQARIRRMGWIATLSICIALYGALHFKVNAVHADVVRAEREIVRLEQRNTLLETEVLTRSSQDKLAEWNRVEFGFGAPKAEQYIDGERRLGELGAPRAENAPEPIRLAAMTTGENAPDFPQLALRRAAPSRANGATTNFVRVEITDAGSADAR